MNSIRTLIVRTTWLQQQKPGNCGNHFWDNMALGDKKRKPDPFRAEPISPTLVTPSSIKDFFSFSPAVFCFSTCGFANEVVDTSSFRIMNESASEKVAPAVGAQWQLNGARLHSVRIQ